MNAIATRATRAGISVAFALLLVATCFAASAGAAATVSMNGPITLTAASGAEDAVGVSKNAFGYVITDNAGATAGAGCTQTNSTTVTCTTTIASQVTLNLGDQLDSVSIDGSLPTTTRVTANGDADGVGIFAASAVNPIVVNSTAGQTIQTGSASDTLTVGSATYTGTIESGAGDDHLNLSTNKANGYDPDYGCTYGNPETCDPIDIYAGNGDDHIVMSSTSTGAFYYNGEPGNDIVIGGGGPDKFASVQDDGDDWYLGGGGGDYFLIYPFHNGTDHLFGEAGNDYADMWPNNGDIMFDGGPGSDKVAPHFSGDWTDDVTISLDGMMDDGSAGEYTDNYMGNVESITAWGIFTSSKNEGSDTLIGNNDVNTIDGYGGADTITGYAGADTLRGGSGDDVINAKDGEIDTVDCGTGTGDVANADTNDNVSNCETVNN